VKVLDSTFFDRRAEQVAHDLIGLNWRRGNKPAPQITETEAYIGPRVPPIACRRDEGPTLGDSWRVRFHDWAICMKPQPQLSTQEVLAGLVERVTFHNTENGFCVLRAKARGHRDLVTVIGHAAAISAGEWITASGDGSTTAPTASSSKRGF
jgi:hypothetical protein